ncbi:unnamed protein product, partial [marine sediment metagenome]
NVYYIKCECRLKFEEEYMQIKANIPPNFHNMSLSILDTEFRTQNQAELRKLDGYGRKLSWAVKTGAGLYLCGKNSVGKSFLGVAILKKALNEGYSVHFTLLEELITNAIHYSKHPQLYSDFIQFIKTVDFLMVDEVDKMDSDRPASILSLFTFLLKERYNAKKPLIVTANMEKVKFLDADFINGGRAIFDEKLISIYLQGDHRTKILKDLEDEVNNGG